MSDGEDETVLIPRERLNSTGEVPDDLVMENGNNVDANVEMIDDDELDEFIDLADDPIQSPRAADTALDSPVVVGAVATPEIAQESPGMVDSNVTSPRSALDSKYEDVSSVIVEMRPELQDARARASTSQTTSQRRSKRHSVLVPRSTRNSVAPVVERTRSGSALDRPLISETKAPPVTFVTFDEFQRSLQTQEEKAKAVRQQEKAMSSMAQLFTQQTASDIPAPETKRKTRHRTRLSMASRRSIEMTKKLHLVPEDEETKSSSADLKMPSASSLQDSELKGPKPRSRFNNGAPKRKQRRRASILQKIRPPSHEREATAEMEVSPEEKKRLQGPAIKALRKVHEDRSAQDINDIREYFKAINYLGKFQFIMRGQVRDAIIACSQIQEYEADTTIFRNGEDADYAIYVIQGTVAVCQQLRPDLLVATDEIVGGVSNHVTVGAPSFLGAQKLRRPAFLVVGHHGPATLIKTSRSTVPEEFLECLPDEGCFQSSDLIWTGELPQFLGFDDRVSMAAQYLNDAFNNRTVFERRDVCCIKPVVELLNHPVFTFVYWFFILLHMSLVWFESPSAAASVYPLYYHQYGTTLTIEALCVCFHIIHVGLRSYSRGLWHSLGSSLILAELVIVICLAVDLIGAFVQVKAASLDTDRVPFVRWSRVMRPGLIIIHSTSVRQVYSIAARSLVALKELVFILLFSMLSWALFGIHLFGTQQKGEVHNAYDREGYETGDEYFQHCQGLPCSELPDYVFWGFDNIGASILSLFVLLTSENYPDISTPPYMADHIFNGYFLLFILFGMLFYLNLVLAVLYDAHRTYQRKISQQRRYHEVRGMLAAFQVLDVWNTHSISESVFTTLVKKMRPWYTRKVIKNMFRTLDESTNALLDPIEWLDVCNVVFQKQQKEETKDTKEKQSLCLKCLPSNFKEKYNEFKDFQRDCLDSYNETDRYKNLLQLLGGLVTAFSIVTLLFYSTSFSFWGALDTIWCMYFTFEIVILFVLLGPRYYFYDHPKAFQNRYYFIITFVHNLGAIARINGNNRTEALVYMGMFRITKVIGLFKAMQRILQCKKTKPLITKRVQRNMDNFFVSEIDGQLDALKGTVTRLCKRFPHVEQDEFSEFLLLRKRMTAKTKREESVSLNDGERNRGSSIDGMGVIQEEEEEEKLAKVARAAEQKRQDDSVVLLNDIFGSALQPKSKKQQQKEELIQIDIKALRDFTLRLINEKVRDQEEAAQERLEKEREALLTTKSFRILDTRKMQNLLRTFILMMPIFIYLCFAMVLVLMYSFGVLGMELMADPANSESLEPGQCSWGQGDVEYNPASRFCSFNGAMATLFQIITTSNWHDIMYSAIGDKSHKGRAWYFVLFYILAVLLMLNMMTAIFIDAFLVESERTREKHAQAEYVEPEELDLLVNKDGTYAQMGAVDFARARRALQEPNARKKNTHDRWRELFGTGAAHKNDDDYKREFAQIQDMGYCENYTWKDLKAHMTGENLD